MLIPTLDMFGPAESHKCRKGVLICRILVMLGSFVAPPTVPLMPNLFALVSSCLFCVSCFVGFENCISYGSLN